MSQSTSGGYQQQYQSGNLNRPLSRRFRKISRVSYRSLCAIYVQSEIAFLLTQTSNPYYCLSLSNAKFNLNYVSPLQMKLSHQQQQQQQQNLSNQPSIIIYLKNDKCIIIKGISTTFYNKSFY